MARPSILWRLTDLRTSADLVTGQQETHFSNSHYYYSSLMTVSLVAWPQYNSTHLSCLVIQRHPTSRRYFFQHNHNQQST